MNESAAASLAEGLDETLMLHRLHVFAKLGVSFKTTNLIESVMARLEAKTHRVTRLAHERSEVAVVRVRAVGNRATVPPREAVSPSALAPAGAAEHPLAHELRRGVSRTISDIACISTTRGTLSAEAGFMFINQRNVAKLYDHAAAELLIGLCTLAFRAIARKL